MSGRLIVFDLDGTLVDSRRDLADSTNAVLEGYGATPLPAAAIASFVGEGARILVERAVQRAGIDVDIDDALSRFRREYAHRLAVHTRPYDGVVDALAGLSTRATLAVLTNKPQEPSERLLDLFGLASSFARVVGGDGPLARKPDPAGLIDLMRSSGAAAASTIMVGDSMIDVETARRAGVRMCVARYGFGAERGDLAIDEGDLVVTTSRELGRVLAGWLGG
jgi:phosphoglycolate phosphatase